MAGRRKPEPIVMVVLEASWKRNEFGPDKITATIAFDADNLIVKAGDRIVIERMRKE